MSESCVNRGNTHIHTVLQFIIIYVTQIMLLKRQHRVSTHSLVLDVSLAQNNLQTLSCGLLHPPRPTANQKTGLMSSQKVWSPLESKVFRYSKRQKTMKRLAPSTDSCTVCRSLYSLFLHFSVFLL